MEDIFQSIKKELDDYMESEYSLEGYLPDLPLEVLDLQQLEEFIGEKETAIEELEREIDAYIDEKTEEDVYKYNKWISSKTRMLNKQRAAMILAQEQIEEVCPAYYE